MNTSNESRPPRQQPAFYRPVTTPPNAHRRPNKPPPPVRWDVVVLVLVVGAWFGLTGALLYAERDNVQARVHELVGAVRARLVDSAKRAGFGHGQL